MSSGHDQSRVPQEPRHTPSPRRAEGESPDDAGGALDAGPTVSPSGPPLPPAGPDGQSSAVVRAARQAAVLRLQRSHGNAYVARAIARERAATPAVQRSVVQRAVTFEAAKRTIEEETERLGTDEEAIYTAIRECSSRARLQADPDVQRWLRDELSGTELWKAQLLLQYGRESAFPRTIRDIWSATEGLGTDEQAILRALRRLSPEEARGFATIPGLRDILRDELSGSDLRETESLLTGNPQAQAQQYTRHRDNVNLVRTELTRMRTAPEPVVRNTAEWLWPAGGGQGRNRLFVVTPTHDSAPRARQHSRPNDVAFFGDQNLFPDDSATYDLDVQSERNIYYSPPAAAGWHGANTIWILDPQAHGAAVVREIFVHETQHDADRHDREAGYGGTAGSPDESWNRYKTEFRAYWVAQFQGFDTTSGSATVAGFDNAKQEAIFNHLYNSTLYNTWLKPNFDNNTQVAGQGFQDLVHGYTQPEGVNLINSPRIDAFYLALDRCQPFNTDRTASPLREAEAAARALNADDRAAVNSNDARRLQTMMQMHLGTAALNRIATIVNGGTLPMWLGTETAPEPTNTDTALA